MCYIPDLTERFPEGFGGVDMTSRYFPSERTLWDDDMEDYTFEIPREEEPKPRVFKVGQEYEWIGWFTGGVGCYTVKKIKDRKLTFAEYRQEIDGEYSKEETFDILTDDNGDEYIKMCEYRGEEGRLYAEG